ncbi:MAG: hypothetical protein J6L95_04390 [Kandleria sp.]|nr:hypothetical protein [Kandleria sp.]
MKKDSLIHFIIIDCRDLNAITAFLKRKPFKNDGCINL